MGRGGHSDDEATPYDQSLEELEFMRGACAAAQRGDLRTLRDAVARRPHLLADDGVGGDSGYAPLHYAAREGHAACVSFLLEAGARVDRATKEGRATALHRAAYTGRRDVIDILLRAGADASIADADGETALGFAAAHCTVPAGVFLAVHVADGNKLSSNAIELLRAAVRGSAFRVK